MRGCIINWETYYNQEMQGNEIRFKKHLEQIKVWKRGHKSKMKEFNIENKKVCIHFNEIASRELPVIILNTYGNEGEEVFNECKSLKCKEYILISISNLDWNNDMTPWFAPKLNKNDVDCLGKADEYLQILLEKIIPTVDEYIKSELHITIKYYGIAGYSLGGLFAVYSAYKTDMFSKIASASGSFWFPDFVEYVKENKISKKYR